MVEVIEGLHSRRIADTPFAVIDFETTGLTPGIDRVIEVSVVRVDPGQEPRFVLDTLVNPNRPVAATEIHGITDADVADAPEFLDIAGDFVDAIAGCVVAAYNVYFDIRFLEFELGQAGVRHVPPHVCLMYLRPLLGLGARCKLTEACEACGIVLENAHMAGADVHASGRLLSLYLELLRSRDVETFSELAGCGSYKFLSSFMNEPFSPATCAHLRRSRRRKSRIPDTRPTVRPTVGDERIGLREYWEGMKIAVADLEISQTELSSLRSIREKYHLKPERIRMIHARAFAGVIAQFVSDQWVDERERMKLQRFHRCLSELGWAPGE